MDNKKQAEWLVKAFKRLKYETGLWAAANDESAKKDLEEIKLAEILLLKDLGFRLSDNGYGQLVKYESLAGLDKEPIDLTNKSVLEEAPLDGWPV